MDKDSIGRSPVENSDRVGTKQVLNRFHDIDCLMEVGNIQNAITTYFITHLQRWMESCETIQNYKVYHRCGQAKLGI